MIEDVRPKRKFWDEKTAIRANIGWTIGMLIGICGAGIATVFFTTSEWYWKILYAVGFIAAIGMMVQQIFQLRNALKSYYESESWARRIMEDMNKDKLIDNIDANISIKGGEVKK